MRNFFKIAALLSAGVATAAMAQAPAAAPAAGAAAPAAGAAAAAQATPAPGAGVTVGAEVKGPQGNPVGTIEEVDAQYATLATPNVKVKLPLNAFAQHPNGLVIGMTQAELEQAAGAAGAQAQATQTAAAQQAASGAAATPPKLEAGVTVNDTSGAPVGKIEEVTGDFAVVATAKNKVRLPLTAFAQAETGPVIGMTEAQLDEAAEAAKPKTGDK